ncbi:MAG: hypothetical protein K6E50_01355 [Lachnospiraceae bacterium]|nr:hypothetical protein [Lachnospiraceae bacterium]
MRKNNRFFGTLLTVGMILALAACGKGDDTDKPADAGQTTQQSSSAETDKPGDDNGGDTNSDPSGYKLTVPAKLTGKLNLIELDDRDPSVLRGVKTMGNSFGSQEDINGKDPSLDDVRCIFGLNEWVEFYPDTDKESGIRVWILKHRDDHEYYADCKFSDLMPDFATYCDLHYPEDAEDPLEWYWGSFYLNPDECEPGYYDFVFTYEGKAIATLVTRFYNDGEMNDKSGAELESLMHE